MEGYPIYTLDGFRARMDQDLAYIEDFDNHADALDNSQRKIKYWEITTTIISLVSGLIAVIYSYLNPTTSMGLYSLAFLLPFLYSIGRSRYIRFKYERAYRKFCKGCKTYIRNTWGVEEHPEVVYVPQSLGAFYEIHLFFTQDPCEDPTIIGIISGEDSLIDPETACAPVFPETY